MTGEYNHNTTGKYAATAWGILLFLGSVLLCTACQHAPATLESFESASLPLQTFSAMGKEVSILEVGKEVEIFRHQGRGCLTHMWFALDERSRIQVYVDGEAAPSIDMQIPMGHGYSFGGEYGPRGTALMGRFGGQHNMYRIPFGTSVRVTILPESEDFDWVTGDKVWWIIRGTENLPVTIGGVTLPPQARLKLYTLEDYTAQPLEEFTLCKVDRPGALYQVAVAVQGEKVNHDWKDQSYQEGCLRAYINGASNATFLSSGLEDYFLSSGYFHHGETYANEAAGLTHFDREQNRFSAYRIHDADPVFFEQGMRLTLRNGETLNGITLHHPPPATYTVYTWVYEW